MADNSFVPTDEDFSKAVFEDGGNIVIDLSGIQELKFEALPKDNYDGLLDELQYGKSKASGQPMLTAIWKIDGGDYAGRKVYQYISFSQKAIRGSKAQLMRLSPEKFSGQFNPAAIAESGDLLGTRKKLKIGVQEGQNGEPSNQVQILPDVVNGGTEGAFFNS